MPKTWNGYCAYCGAFGHRPENCRWNRGAKLARPVEA